MINSLDTKIGPEKDNKGNELWNKELSKFLDEKKDAFAKDIIPALQRMSNVMEKYNMVLAGSAALQLEVLAQRYALCRLPADTTRFLSSTLSSMPRDLDLMVVEDDSSSQFKKELSKSGLKMEERKADTFYFDLNGVKVTVKIGSLSGNECYIGIAPKCDIVCHTPETIMKGKYLRQNPYGYQGRHQETARIVTQTKDEKSIQSINELLKLEKKYGIKFSQGGDIF